ncbi:MAG: YHS domain-containing protein [Thermoanaerobaculia bacterium]|nr:YHS domain-containing protein [Thermoanaerobaculia bacterium]
MLKLTSVLLGTVLSFSLFGSAKAVVKDGYLVNVDSDGVILDGYDPVAFFTDGKPVEGDPKFQSQYQGAIYHFATAEHKASFDADPAKYAPQFGGYCAYAASKGDLAAIDVDYFSIVDGRLLLQYSSGAMAKWSKDVRGNLAAADENWPELVKKNGGKTAGR